MIIMFDKKDDFLMENENLDDIDNLFDDVIFDCNIVESIDPETLKLLEEF